MNTVHKFQLDKFVEFPILIKLYELSKSRGIKLYLVGGALRDILLQKAFCDYDFALEEDPISFAKEFADSIKASFVVLDEGNLFTSRVIYKTANTQHSSHIIFDFVKFRGRNIIEDLRLRDLNINAMAVDFDELFSSGSSELIDPTKALKEIQGGKIRFVSEKSITDDPLRMLRAYRLAAALNFDLVLESRSAVKAFSSHIHSSAWERIRDEFVKILSEADAASTIEKLDADGLLKEILPEFGVMKGVGQNQYHHLDVWDHSLLALRLFEAKPIPDSLKIYLDQINEYLSERISGCERLVWLKFAMLLHDIGKPLTKCINEKGQINFFKHEVEGAKIAVQIADRFKLSSRAKGILETVVRHHLRTMHLSSAQTTQKAMYRFIRDCKDEWLGVLLVSHADLLASRGMLRKEDDITKNHELMTDIAQLYFEKILPSKKSPKLVSGDDLIKEFKLQPSPLIGEILEKVEEAKLDGKVKSKDEAMEFVRELVEPKGKI